MNLRFSPVIKRGNEHHERNLRECYNGPKIFEGRKVNIVLTCEEATVLATELLSKIPISLFVENGIPKP